MSTHATGLTDTSAIAATRWRIDPARSSIEFEVPNFWGLTIVKGRFTQFQGTLDLAADPAVALTIEAASLDTRNGRRDEHLRSPDFFGAEQHPYVRFVSERATLDGERLTVRGRLHARGATMPLRIRATLRRTGDELELEAAGEAEHRELGMTWNALGTVGKTTTLIVRGRLVADGPARPA